MSLHYSMMEVGSFFKYQDRLSWSTPLITCGHGCSNLCVSYAMQKDTPSYFFCDLLSITLLLFISRQNWAWSLLELIRLKLLTITTNWQNIPFLICFCYLLILQQDCRKKSSQVISSFETKILLPWSHILTSLTCNKLHLWWTTFFVAGRGGQSALRFARLRMEKRHNYVRKVAELAVQLFISNDRVD